METPPYCVSKAMLNMTVRLMFNELRPEGYTFRVYHPGWVRSYMSGKRRTGGIMNLRSRLRLPSGSLRRSAALRMRLS